MSRISNYPNALAENFEQYKSYFCLFDPCFLRLMMTVLGPTFLNPDYILLSLFCLWCLFWNFDNWHFSFPIKIILSTIVHLSTSEGSSRYPQWHSIGRKCFKTPKYNSLFSFFSLTETQMAKSNFGVANQGFSMNGVSKILLPTWTTYLYQLLLCMYIYPSNSIMTNCRKVQLTSQLLTFSLVYLQYHEIWS